MPFARKKRIALVAHDNRKNDMVEWVRWNYKILMEHQLICTGTTGRLVEEAILQEMQSNPDIPEKKKQAPLRIIKLKSGPFGGDQQLGAMIAEGRIDILIFLWDPMQPQPHDVDVKALLRISVLYNIPSACNRSTADFMISSQLMKEEYQPILKDYSSYLNRTV
ncbi:MAG: methylglyoxal synthase [Bacteroidales bacterium]|nr:methylglyoxal synthase [Bacteroidales bacterium]